MSGVLLFNAKFLTIQHSVKSPGKAMCDFRGLNVYYFLTCGDLLDAPKWDARMEKNQKKHTQHDPGHFDIDLELACYVTD